MITIFIKHILIVILILQTLQLVAANNKKKIICYHGSWSYYRKSLGKFDISTDIDPFLCTHLIYAFVGLDAFGNLQSKNKQLDFSVKGGLGNYQKFNNLKTKNPTLKTLLSVGGSKTSKNFSITAADPVKRLQFVESSLDFIRSYGFDGLDIDWEYPNQYHDLKENNDRENFVELLKELRERFQPFDYLLTAAVGPAEYLPHLSYNITEMVKYLDFINIMAYDLHGPWESSVGHNAPIYASNSDITDRAKQHSFDGLAKYWLAQGAPSNKLVMGIPFYARSFTLKDPHNAAVNSLHIGPGIAGQYTKQPGILTYNEFCEFLVKDKLNWHFEWDSVQKVPFAVNNNQWISYDNETSISLKVDYVKRENLAGIMLWTIEMDDFRGVCEEGKRYPLLSLINENLKKVEP